MTTHPLQNKKVLFVVGANGRDELMYRIANVLTSKYSIKARYVCTYPRNASHLRKAGVPDEHMHHIYEFTREAAATPSLAYLAACEERYNMLIWDVWETTRSRKKQYVRWSKERVLAYFEYVFRQSEQVFAAESFDYVCFLGVATYLQRTLFNVAKTQSSPFELCHSKLPNRFAIRTSFEDTWPLLQRNHTLSLERSGSEMQQAKEYLEQFRASPESPYKKKGRPSFSERMKIIAYWFRGLVADKRMPTDLEFITRSIKQKFYSATQFQRSVPGEKFIYFPLHMQPEATTLIFGKYFVHQPNTVALIAKSLPVGYQLYVKEHPVRFGNRSRSFYRELRALPNVRLIHPHENSFQLMKQSKAVIAITGTAGLEAFFLGKPSMTLGYVFYNMFPEIMHVSDVNTLPQRICKLLQIEKIDEDSILRHTATLFASTHSGFVGLPHENNNRTLRTNNIQQIAAGIATYTEATH